MLKDQNAADALVLDLWKYGLEPREKILLLHEQLVYINISVLISYIKYKIYIDNICIQSPSCVLVCCRLRMRSMKGSCNLGSALIMKCMKLSSARWLQQV